MGHHQTSSTRSPGRGPAGRPPTPPARRAPAARCRRSAGRPRPCSRSANVRTRRTDNARTPAATATIGTDAGTVGPGAPSWALPNRSTHVTSARTSRRPSATDPISTTGSGTRTSSRSSTRPPSASSAVPAQSAAAAGANTSRPSNVAGPIDRPPVVRLRPLGRRLEGDRPADAAGPAPRRPGAARCPGRRASGGPGRRSPARRPGAGRRPPGRRPPARPPGPRWGTALTSARRAGPDVVRRDLVDEVDDRDGRRQPAQHRVDDADELVRQPVVGEEVDRVGARWGRRRYRRPGAGQPAFVSRSPR